MKTKINKMSYDTSSCDMIILENMKIYSEVILQNIPLIHPALNTQHPTLGPNTLPSNNLHQLASTIGLLPRGKA